MKAAVSVVATVTVIIATVVALSSFSAALPLAFRRLCLEPEQFTVSSLLG